MKIKKISIETIKKALLDTKFRNLFPEYREAIDKWMVNPGCKCNVPLYESIYAHKDRLKSYFGNDVEFEEEEEDIQKNHWTVFHGHIDDLEAYLQSLPHGPKQIALARWEDQVTLIVNDPQIN